MSTATGHRPHVVVLGGGYAGVMAANRLTEQAVDVTLVNPRPHFVQRIRLHQWASATGSGRGEFTEMLGSAVHLRVDTAEHIDAARGQVRLASGGTLTYDGLVYAVGSIPAPVDTIPGGHHAFHPVVWEEAERLRAHLKQAGPGPVTVIGGGLAGIEMAAELASAGHTPRLIAGATLAPSVGPKARAQLRRRLGRLGVEVADDARAVEIGADTVTVVADGTTTVVPSPTTIVLTGFAVPELARTSGLRTDPMGRLITDATLTSVDDPRIVGAGDASTLRGIGYRMSCQAAQPTGTAAADTVLAHLAGSPATPVKLLFVGQSASLGRRDAVIQLTRTDDSPTRTLIVGRVGAMVKEMVGRATMWSMRCEARRPGSLRRVMGGHRPPKVELIADADADAIAARTVR